MSTAITHHSNTMWASFASAKIPHGETCANGTLWDLRFCYWSYCCCCCLWDDLTFDQFCAFTILRLFWTLSNVLHMTFTVSVCGAVDTRLTQTPFSPTLCGKRLVRQSWPLAELLRTRGHIDINHVNTRILLRKHIWFGEACLYVQETIRMWICWIPH